MGNLLNLGEYQRTIEPFLFNLPEPGVFILFWLLCFMLQVKWMKEKRLDFH